MTVQHPFPPFVRRDSEILILGSFPSVKSRETGFFYGHPQNRFWRVCASVFADAVPETVEEKKAFLAAHRIALWDVIAACEIVGSSDASIQNAVPNDLAPLLAEANIQKIFVNGRTAEALYRKYTEPVLHRGAVLLPSTSPANAAWHFERLCAVWAQIRL